MPNGGGYRALAPYYDIFIDWDKRLEKEIPFILDSLERPPLSLRCLDVGCGTGRHLQRLAEAGMEVEGCEPSEHLRSLAEDNLPDAPIHPHTMERLPELAGDRGGWDLVICLGNTLPHLPAEDRMLFFTGLALGLNRGGTAVIHLLNYEKIMADRPDGLPEKKAEKDGHRIVFQRLYSYTRQGIEFTVRVLADGELVGEQKEMLYPLTAAELRELCRAAELRDLRLFGGFDRSSKYTPDQGGLVAVIRN